MGIIQPGCRCRAEVGPRAGQVTHCAATTRWIRLTAKVGGNSGSLMDNAESGQKPETDTQVSVADGETMSGPPSDPGRRSAMKVGAVAAGVAAAAWAVPVVSGVGVAPAAAAGCSDPLPTPPLPASKDFAFNVTSNTGGCSDPAEWTGAEQTNTETFDNTCTTVTYGSVTVKAPVGNLDNPCFATPSTIVGFSGWSNCVIVDFDTVSCPPAGIAAVPNACGVLGAGGCSAALNGSGSGIVNFRCFA
jgi:hypothetical protein